MYGKIEKRNGKITSRTWVLDNGEAFGIWIKPKRAK